MLRCWLVLKHFPLLDCNRKLYTYYNFEVPQSTQSRCSSQGSGPPVILLGFVDERITSLCWSTVCISHYSNINKTWSAFQATLTISQYWLKAIKMSTGGCAGMVDNTLKKKCMKTVWLEFPAIWKALKVVPICTLTRSVCCVICVCDNAVFCGSTTL